MTENTYQSPNKASIPLIVKIEAKPSLWDGTSISRSLIKKHETPDVFALKKGSEIPVSYSLTYSITRKLNAMIRTRI